MNKKLILISVLLLFLVSSCKSLRYFDVFDLNDLKLENFNGKIDSIKSTIKLFALNKDTTKIVMTYYFKDGKIIESSEYYPKIKTKNTYRYIYNEKDLLENYGMPNYSNNLFEYDKNGNLIRHRYIVSNEINFDKKFEYDKNKNLAHVHFQSNKKNWETYYNYNYKENYYLVTTQELPTNNRNSYFKISFSNQNKTILIEKYIYDDSILGKKLVQYFIIQLDKFGNMIERKYFNHNNSIVKTQEFIYTYDKKGNVLKKESIDNGKLYEIITNEISYKN
ncbi:hypothetical protein [Flavobacterium sp.]|uniref:hypothetical protein n=1 Tax=Flavobacterium sp. TaxID=239 RepID=UPI003F6A190D